MVLPGGVDELVHLVEPIGPEAPADDLASGTVAAATGGTTTVVVPADDPADVHRRAAGNAFVDWAVLQRGVPEGAPDAAVAGVLLELDGRDRLTVEDALDVLLAARERAPAGHRPRPRRRDGGRARAAGRRRPRGAAAGERRGRAAGAAGGLGAARRHDRPPRCRSPRPPRPTRSAPRSRARRRWRTSACRPPPPDALLAPPHRGAADGLWAALADGRLQGVASDHRPPSLRRQPDMAPHVGIAAAALRLPLLHTEGVAAGRIDLPRLAALTAELPARRLGLWPRKGSLEPGADADVVLLDPTARWTVESARVEGRGRAPAWDGRELDRARALGAGPRRLDRARRQRPLPPRPRAAPVAAGPATG